VPRTADVGVDALWEAFGSITALANALREVAPPIVLAAPLTVWRGGIVHPDDHPTDIAIGLSWTVRLRHCLLVRSQPRWLRTHGGEARRTPVRLCNDRDGA
jgi:hypothetical protein